MSTKPAWLKAHGVPWKELSRRVVFETPWMAVTEHEAIAPTGKPAYYGAVRMKNYAIAVLPIFEDGTILMVGQHRFVLGDYSWEIPEGGGPIDVDPLESAKRELSEETGLNAAEWREVVRAQLSNSLTDERMFGYLAFGLSAADDGHAADHTEDLAVARVPFREALEACVAGHLQDVLTVAMLLRAYHMAREGSLPGALARAMLG